MQRYGQIGYYAMNDDSSYFTMRMRRYLTNPSDLNSGVVLKPCVLMGVRRGTIVSEVPLNARLSHLMKNYSAIFSGINSI